MSNKPYKNLSFLLTTALGIFLVLLVVALGVSFYFAISDAQLASRKVFLNKQTELAARELEMEIDKFEDDAESMFSFLEDKDLDLDDYRQDLTTVTRKVVNSYPGLIDTVWVNLVDSAVYFTMTDRNDFLRTPYNGFVRSNYRENSSLYRSNPQGMQALFRLNLSEFTKDFVTNYYLNAGGGKFLLIGDQIINLNPQNPDSPIEFDKEVFNTIKSDVAVGLKGMYNIQLREGDRKIDGILVQYPFDFGNILENASLIFFIETEQLTSGIYNTYLLLFSVLILLLIGTIIFFILSLRNNQNYQKQLEKNSKEISELFDQQNLLLKELKGFVYFHNHKGEITDVSEEMEKILGSPKDVFLEAFRPESTHEDVLRLKQKVYDALDAKTTFLDFEYDYVRPDKRKIRVKIFEKLLFDKNGRFNGGIGICTDITSQFEFSQKLIQSENRLRTVLENIPDVIFIYDNEGNVIDFHVKDKIPGWDKSSLGKNISILLPPDQRDETLQAFDIARREGQIQTVNRKLNLPTGTRYFEIRYFPLDEDRMMSLAKDITNQKIWEKGLVEAMNAADEASRAKSEFLANMSHEIRTPMNGLLGIIDLLEMTPLDSEQTQYLEIIKNSGNSLLGIIKDILDYSKIEAGKMDINPTVGVPAEELEKQIQIFYGLAQKKKIKITTAIGSEARELFETDFDRINQVLLNLVGNAVKFTPMGGSVSISMDVEKIEDDLFYLKTQIKDSGIGIPEELIPMLTEPFFQVESSSTRSFQGTGLGLAIAKRIIELMGGELDITSKVGEGSKFSFSVLINKANVEKEALKNKTSDERKNWFGMGNEYPLRLLLAEDNDLNLQLMQLMLDQLGYKFDIARNGLDALKMVMKKEYDMVLMDVQMPVMNGLEATRKIRETPGMDKLFIVGLSANVFDEDQKKAIESGMDDYLTKPIRLIALAQKLEYYYMKKQNVKA
ncbi:PAS domain-containing hybrid sensor histidine kinase/response regulator [Algoriphagus pacificus]|uniref:histidine kinase n=1 Tax=Algoriphagus pacificus TaxID=2811234 RepID=A0ABS3CIT8_9BACT|nr:PAS domain-containing hybrid sensor histidine kinase/response regulator [Algoriphagus pacificus]MBN7816076.1 response regulator [Algoriphagus pacificus]